MKNKESKRPKIVGYSKTVGQASRLSGSQPENNKWTGGTPVLLGEGIQFFSGGSYKV